MTTRNQVDMDREETAGKLYNVILLRSCLIVMVLFGEAPAHPFCFSSAESEYGVSAVLLRAMAFHESGNNPRAVNYNKDGSYDFGLMQINSGWYSSLGPNRWDRLGDPCYNTRVGAWILARCVQRHGYTWEAVGCYNAKSSSKRIKYAWNIYSSLQRAGRGKAPRKSNIFIAQ